ncbi:MAG TPA: right-handed parallel beta-helix repeat-containing protein, partial [Candidatus Bilamarchaeum sp.]|nr:right-handed parallel beta-helix repeat-containing protein [Candidatus Bilamarchaeum sp.]
MRPIILLVALIAVFGLSFSVNVSSCMQITSPGDYNLTADFSGAPYSYYFGSYTTCIQINASSVTLDCGGHSITTTGNAAVEVEAPGTNVIVKNCVLNGGIGVDVLGMSGGRIVYNTINPGYAGISGVLAFAGWTGSDILYNNITGGTYGIWEPGDSNLIGNNRLINQGSVGLIDAGTGNMITNNYISGSGGDGMIIDGSGQYVDSNTVDNSAGNGVDIYSYNQTFTFNTISNSGNYGIWAGGEGSGDYTPDLGSISYNTIYNSGNTGLEVRGATLITFANNNIYNNAEGVHLQNSAGEGFHPAVGNVFSGNNVHDNTGDGFNVFGVTGNSFVLNTGSNNGNNGMYLDSVDSVLVDPSFFCNNFVGV